MRVLPKAEALRSYLETEIATQMLIPNRVLNVMMEADASLRAHVVTAALMALSVPIWHIEYPADWWQAFKGRWFPRWLKHRFPVRMTEHRAARYCPHMGVDDTEPHLAFLNGDSIGSATEPVHPSAGHQEAKRKE